jgi:hypothetical protein
VETSKGNKKPNKKGEKVIKNLKYKNGNKE